MARSASMALAAQAAAAASLRRHTPLTPVSPPSPSHTTHDYTPGSFTYSRSMSATPEALMNRRAELDGTEALSAGERCLLVLLVGSSALTTPLITGVVAAYDIADEIHVNCCVRFNPAYLLPCQGYSEHRQCLPPTACKMAVAGAGMPQASASHQQAAAHEQQQSFIPESQAPAYVVDVSAEEPATAEEASNVEVDTASATIDSTAAEQSSQQQQVDFAFATCADRLCFSRISC